MLDKHLKMYFAYTLVLACLAFRADAAGIQLLNSDPGLAGAIWWIGIGGSRFGYATGRDPMHRENKNLRGAS